MLQDGKWKRTGPKEMMVNETSACLYLPNEERISIYANHSMIAKLGDEPESRYHDIKDHIATHAKDAPAVVQRRCLEAECVVALSEVYQLAYFVYAVVCALQTARQPELVKKSFGDQIVQNSVRVCHFITPSIAKMADIFSISTRYGQLFHQIPQVRKALIDIFDELLLFLRRSKTLLKTRSIKLFIKSFLRPVDIELEGGHQCINRKYQVFQDEATLVHRQHLKDHVLDQRIANEAIRGALKSGSQTLAGSHNSRSTASKDIRSIVTWLGPSDYQDSLRRATVKRVPGTGKWLTKTPQFEYWLKEGQENSPSRSLVSETRYRDIPYPVDWLPTLRLGAALAIQTLQQATSIDDTIELLAETPSGVHDMYALILQRLSAEPNRRLSMARKALRLLCTTTRPLTWPEFRRALSWDADRQEFRPTSAPFKDTILDLCCPLIEYREETDNFRLVHLSLYEYLCNQIPNLHIPQDLAQFMVNNANVRNELAQMTLSQIADPSVSEEFNPIGCQQSFVAYSTKNWCHHLSLSPYDPQLLDQYHQFTACPDRRSIWILRRLLSEDSSFPLRQIIKLQNLVSE
ncbi:MAG: hypothetical protein Q9170_000691 [Blastenia crenularia]